jgi:hypothetical protein
MDTMAGPVGAVAAERIAGAACLPALLALVLAGCDPTPTLTRTESARATTGAATSARLFGFLPPLGADGLDVVNDPGFSPTAECVTSSGRVLRRFDASTRPAIGVSMAGGYYTVTWAKALTLPCTLRVSVQGRLLGQAPVSADTGHIRVRFRIATGAPGFRLALAGDTPRVAPGGEVRVRLVARDSAGQPVAGLRIGFGLPAGGGTLTPGSAVTAADGSVSTRFVAAADSGVRELLATSPALAGGAQSVPLRIQISWATAADKALRLFALTRGDEPAHAFAWAARAHATLRGWQDSTARALLDSVAVRVNPDGGFGVGVAYDALGDGTVNEANTTYLITVTDHVGMTYLEAAEAGVIPAAYVSRMVGRVLAADSAQAGDSTATCLPYSLNPNDAAVCVHNVNAASGWFLLEAYRRGYASAGVLPLVDRITRREQAAYLPAEFNWPYRDDVASRNNCTHAALQAEAMRSLDPPLGAVATEAVFDGRVRQCGRLWYDPLGRARLLPFDCSRAAGLLPGYWALVNDARQDPRRLAVSAWIGARAARACDA